MKYLTTNQAAEELGVSRRRVLALITAGRLPAEMFGRDYMILPKDLDKVRVRKSGRPVGYRPPPKSAAAPVPDETEAPAEVASGPPAEASPQEPESPAET